MWRTLWIKEIVVLMKMLQQDCEKSGADTYESIGYTCTLDKAHCFFQDDHVQNIRYHPIPCQQDYVCLFT